MLKVLKFGGSSMADAKQFAKVRDIVRADDSRRVVVVSAAGKRDKNDHKITDLLYLCHAHLQYGVSCDAIYEMIRSRYVGIRDELGLRTPLEAELDALRQKMDKGISADELVSRGEYFAAELMADYLGYGFLDTDLVIQQREGLLLQDILDQFGVKHFLQVEEEAIRSEIRKLVQKEDAAYQREAEKRQQNLKNYTPEGRRKDKGLLEAQRSLLYYAAQHQGIYDTLKEILEEDDFTEGIYWRTFGDIGDLWQNAGHVFPADLVSRFEDAKEQKQVTEIFAVQLPTENGADMEKAINEQVKRLKRTKIDHLTANAATVEEIQRLVDAKRKLDSLYITI